MDNEPGAEVVAAVADCLDIARTWIGWDGRPLISEDGDRIYTPHKAIRRIADHLIDHLAEVEALLAGVPTQEDQWHGSLLTLEADWARFTEADLEEAVQRLTRLARTFELRLASVPAAELDRSREPNWTLRAISAHLTGVRWYAEQVGRLSPLS